MKKLKLAPENLDVTTFEATPHRALEPRDAIPGFAPTRQTRCDTCRTLCLPYC